MFEGRKITFFHIVFFKENLYKIRKIICFVQNTQPQCFDENHHQI